MLIIRATQIFFIFEIGIWCWGSKPISIEAIPWGQSSCEQQFLTYNKYTQSSQWAFTGEFMMVILNEFHFGKN